MRLGIQQANNVRALTIQIQQANNVLMSHEAQQFNLPVDPFAVFLCMDACIHTHTHTHTHTNHGYESMPLVLIMACLQSIHHSTCIAMYSALHGASSRAHRTQGYMRVGKVSLPRDLPADPGAPAPVDTIQEAPLQWQWQLRRFGLNIQ